MVDEARRAKFEKVSEEILTVMQAHSLDAFETLAVLAGFAKLTCRVSGLPTDVFIAAIAQEMEERN
jgi:hypothetical protein